MWEVKIININKINDIEHGKRKFNLLKVIQNQIMIFINLLEIAFNDFLTKLKLNQKHSYFIYHIKITINNLEIFNTKLKHILIKYFHFKYNQHSFDMEKHKWILFFTANKMFLKLKFK